MFKLIIFAGTTEGRRLAEFCGEHNICADISVATEYGAELLPHSVGVRIGRADKTEMSIILKNGGYSMAVDATHPYAKEATANILHACQISRVPYVRLLRERSVIHGQTAIDTAQIVDMMNKENGIILSTLGSKSFSELAKIHDHFNRVWLRALPSENIIESCRSLGFDTNKLICQQGPFTVEQNIEHIKLSGADWLITNDSGTEGGYPQKITAAEKSGIKTLTLLRPEEEGCDFRSVTEMILAETETNK